MITLKQTKAQIVVEPRWWRIALFDFVDDFRQNRDLSQISEPFELSDDQTDALLASTAESLCDELKLTAPAWLREVPAAVKPYFVAGIENLKATAIVESPLRFRIRKVFVMANFLSRV